MGPQTSVIFTAFHMLLLLKFSVQKSDNTSLIYRAAVVEYSPPLGITLDTKEDHYRRNAETFARITKRAAELECDIIVFPEYGLLSMDLPKLEDGSPSLAVRIPTPEEKINPCVDDKDGLYKDLTELSCAAKDNRIYLVVNVVEVERCSGGGCGACPGSDKPPSKKCTTKDRPCPKNEAFYYNSNVVFDREGNVVARYRMYHLYGEMPLVPPEKPEYTVLQTDFGIRFGMFISFDISFQEPASNLVTELGVRDILYTTCWFSEMPFQTAVQYQAAWSHAMDVNLLAAGYNYPEYGSGGSGIYAGKMGTLVAVMPQVRSSYLLVATVVKKHAPCYDQFFKILPNGLVIPLAGEPPYEYDRDNPVTEPVRSPSKADEEPSSPKLQRTDRDCTAEEEGELGTPEEFAGEETQQETAPGCDAGDVKVAGQEEEQEEEEPSSEKKCPCCQRRPLDGALEKPTGPSGEEDQPEPPAEVGGKGKCGMKNLNGELEGNGAEVRAEPPEEQDYSEPPAKAGRKAKCGMKNLSGKPVGNGAEVRGETPEEQDYSEPPAKAGRKAKCGMKNSNGKPVGNGAEVRGEPPEEQDYSEPPAKAGRKAKCGMKNSNWEPERNTAEVRGEPPEEEDYSEPPAKARRKAKCGRKNSNGKPERNTTEVRVEPPEEQEYSEPPAKVGGEKQCECGIKNLDGEPDEKAPDESGELPEEQDYSEPPAKVGGEKQCECGIKNLDGEPDEKAPDESGELPEEQDYSEPPAKVGGEKQCECGIKNLDGEPDEKAPDESGELPEEQDDSEPPAKAGRKRKCGMKNSNGKLDDNGPEKSGEPSEEDEPLSEVGGDKMCYIESLEAKPEDSAAEESEGREPEPPTDFGEEVTCGGRKLSLYMKLQDVSEEGEGHEDEEIEDDRQLKGYDCDCSQRRFTDDESQSEDERRFTDVQSQTEEEVQFTDDESQSEEELPFTDAQSQSEEEHESMEPSEQVNEYTEEVGGGTEENMIDEGEYQENVAQRESSEEKVVTNLPHPCIEEALFTRYAKKWQPSYALPQNKPGSGLHVKRERLENYITFRLTADKMRENSSVRLCHGTFCCDFDVVMCSGEECSGGMCSSCDGPRYNYRLVAFDGLRNMDQFGEGRYQVCAVISCADENLQSCGQFIKDRNVNVNYTRFYKLLVSGVFKRMNSIIGANTVAYNLLPLPVSKFEFFSEELADDELAVKMESIAPELTFLTFGIYGRNYDVDDYRINKLVCEV